MKTRELVVGVSLTIRLWWRIKSAISNLPRL